MERWNVLQWMETTEAWPSLDVCVEYGLAVVKKGLPFFYSFIAMKTKSRKTDSGEWLKREISNLSPFFSIFSRITKYCHWLVITVTRVMKHLDGVVFLLSCHCFPQQRIPWQPHGNRVATTILLFVPDHVVSVLAYLLCADRLHGLVQRKGKKKKLA